VEQGQILRTAQGAVLFAANAASLLESAGEALFDPAWWRARGALAPVSAGRGSAWFVNEGADHWVLRHYRRGGLPGRFLDDRFFWLGESRVRAFAEWRLTSRLYVWGLPVPEPIAARYLRQGWGYRCDLITRRIPDAVPLSACLAAAPLALPAWRGVGAAVSRLHAHGVDHADLNAHNILLGPGCAVSVVDFDRGRIHAEHLHGGHDQTEPVDAGRVHAGRVSAASDYLAPDRGRHAAAHARLTAPWQRRNLARLRRSLLKISAALAAGRFGEPQWRELLQGYGAQEGGR